jgi:FAD binding domain in molybdopterin dehydrogenase
MIPAQFAYRRAGSVAQAIDLLTEHADEAKLLAGGHSLLPMMKLRFARPALVIDIGDLPGLDYIRAADGEIAIGALTRHVTLETSPLLAEAAPLLRHAASAVGDCQIRHRGTIGGSVAHGDPSADLPAALMALRGTVIAEGPGYDPARERRRGGPALRGTRQRGRPAGRCRRRSGERYRGDARIPPALGPHAPRPRAGGRGDSLSCPLSSPGRLPGDR